MYDIRSYEIQECVSKKQDLLCVLEDENHKILGKMNIPLKKLKQKRWIKKAQTVPSKIYPGQFYDLLSVEWSPEKELTKDEWEKKYLR